MGYNGKYYQYLVEVYVQVAQSVIVEVCMGYNGKYDQYLAEVYVACNGINRNTDY
jgi:hypothetical protein